SSTGNSGEVCRKIPERKSSTDSTPLLHPSTTPPPPGKPVIALVLASGGLKPLSALPLLEFLDSEGIKEDLLVGCSGGGIVSALRASGYSCADIRGVAEAGFNKRMFQKNWRTLLGMYHLPGGCFDKTSGIFKPDQFLRRCTELFGGRRMEELQTKLILQVTDFDTGEGVGLSQGRLADAVYASMAIYPFFPPIQMNGRWLFDGCYSAPVPMMQAVNYPADIIIVVEVLENLSAPPSGFFNSMVHINKIFAQTIIRNQMTLSVMLHDYEIIYVKVRFEKYLQIWDFKALPMIYAAGQAALEPHKQEILDVIREFRPTSSSSLSKS
ncbi:MAG: patatin-like phospholipase family protein, partial [Lentisphaerota bacterium]